MLTISSIVKNTVLINTLIHEQFVVGTMPLIFKKVFEFCTMNSMGQYFLKGQLLILSLQNPSLPHIWMVRSIEWYGRVWIYAKNYIYTQDLKHHISNINGLA